MKPNKRDTIGLLRATNEKLGRWNDERRSALDQIALLLDGTEWSPDTLEGIANIIRGTGRVVRDPDDVAPL